MNTELQELTAALIEYSLNADTRASFSYEIYISQPKKNMEPTHFIEITIHTESYIKRCKSIKQAIAVAKALAELAKSAKD